MQPIKTEPRESQSDNSQEVITYSTRAILNQAVTPYQEEEEGYEDYVEEQHYMEESMVSAGAGIFVKMNQSYDDKPHGLYDRKESCC